MVIRSWKPNDKALNQTYQNSEVSSKIL